MTTALAGRLSVEELVRTYEEAEADVRRAFGIVAGALGSLNAAMGLDHHEFNLRRGRHYTQHVTWNEPEEHIRELRRQAWQALIERMEVRKYMSIAAWTTFQKQIDDGEPPPIDVATIKGMIDQFQADIPDMLQVAVKEVFEWLRPPSSRYKTNTEFEIGERVVLTWMVERSYGKWRVRYDREQNLLALENVLAIVGGLVPQQAGYYSKISTAIKACPSESCHGATDMMEFRGFQNGNLHLKFRRIGLVKRLNAIAGGTRLKPPAPRGEDARP